MNGQITITTSSASADFLAAKLDWILDLMDKEHQNCTTHAQRNNYQAVIRHELELLRDFCKYSIKHDQPADAGNIPF